jgi:hypothetical protein
MPQRFVIMPMNMRLCRIILVNVRMMLVVNVSMLMPERLMQMLMLVAFGDVKTEADAHQNGGQSQLQSWRLVQERHCERSADEWRQREIRPRS